MVRIMRLVGILCMVALSAACGIDTLIDKLGKDKGDDCSDENHSGYQVWAGDTAYFSQSDIDNYYLNINNHGYSLVGGSSVTQTFNTGTRKYYVIVADDYSCLDAVRFADGSYMGGGSARIHSSGTPDYEKWQGAPDGVSGKLGSVDKCSSGTFQAYITDEATIVSRGGGLTVVIGEDDCQSD